MLVATVLGLFGPLFGFPDWLVHLSPIAVAPDRSTGDGVDVHGLWWLLLAVAAIGVAAARPHAPARTGSGGVTRVEHPGLEPAEQAAAMLTAAGMPRMPARVMMALVGSPDAGYTAAELADRLGVSAAAVSGAVRYLQSIRMIQRLPRRGDRRDRYDIIDDGWHVVLTANMPLYERLADFVDRGRRRERGRAAVGARARATCRSSSASSPSGCRSCSRNGTPSAALTGCRPPAPAPRAAHADVAWNRGRRAARERHARRDQRARRRCAGARTEPDADIFDDAVAVARLTELEERLRRERCPPRTVTSRPDASPSAAASDTGSPSKPR